MRYNYTVILLPLPRSQHYYDYNSDIQKDLFYNKYYGFIQNNIIIMHKVCKYFKRDMMTSILVLISLLRVSNAAMTYPIHLGGFSGDTEIQRFAFDTAGNLAVSGLSSDTSMVSPTSTHFVMYLAAGADSWTWYKQIVGFAPSVLQSMAIGAANAQIALMFQSRTLIVFDNGGNMIRASKETTDVMSCESGHVCQIQYSGSLLNVITGRNGVSTRILSNSFNPAASGFPATFKQWDIGANFIIEHLAVGYNTIIVGGHTGGNREAIVNIATNHAQMNYAAEIFSNYKVKLLLLVSWSYQPCWCCCELEPARMLYILSQSVSTLNEFQYQGYELKTNTQAEFDFIARLTFALFPGTVGKALDIKEKDTKTAWIMMQYTGSTASYIAILEIGLQTWYESFGGCWCWKDTASYKMINQLTNSLSLVNGWIQNYDTFYGGGNLPEDLYVILKRAAAPNYKVSFVHNFDPNNNVLDQKVTISASASVSFTPSSSGASISYQTLSLPVSTPSISSTNTIGTVQPMVTPSSTTPYYQITSADAVPLIEVATLLDSPTAVSLTVMQPSGCNNVCTAMSLEYDIVLPNQDPSLQSGVVLSTFDSVAYTVILHTTNQAMVGSQYIINVKGQLPMATFTSAEHLQSIYRITVAEAILAEEASIMPIESYYIDDPAQPTQAKPVLPYSHTINPTTVAPMLSDSRLVVQYDLVDLNQGSTRPSWITNYDQASRVATIYATDEALEGTYTLNVVAWFTYRPQLVNRITTTKSFTVNLIDKCRKTVIAPSPFVPSPVYYQVGQPALKIPITDWTHTYTVADCGPFTYTLAVNPRPAALTQTGALELTIFTTIDTEHMVKLSSRDPSLDTQVRGALYKPAASPLDLFKDLQVPFDFRIISTNLTYIIPSTQPNDIQYIVRDPLQVFPLGTFTKVDTDNPILQMVFELRAEASGGSSLDSQVVQMSVVGGDQPELRIYTTSNDKIGEARYFVRAKFQIGIPYYVDGPSFKVSVLHQCVRNIITGRTIDDRAYNISTPQLSFKTERWSVTDYSCGVVTYQLKLESGAQAPNFIRFDPSTSSFSVYSMAAGVAGTYYVLLEGTTQYYNAILSTNQQRFKLQINCFTTVVRPKAPVIDVNFQLGIGTLEYVSFQDFEVWPMCGTPEQVMVYSGKLQTGEVLPSGITLKQRQRKVEIQDDGSLRPGDYVVQVYGTAQDSKIRSFFILNLKVLPAPPAFKDLMIGYIKLPMALLQVTPNQTLVFTSQDFLPFNIEYTVLKPDSNMKFITVSGQVITITPKVRDIGTHNLRLVAYSDKGDKYFQDVRVKVGFARNASEFSQFREIEAKIVKISRTGIVQILFNQNMQPISNLSLVTNHTLQLKVNSKYLDKADFTWRCTEYSSRQMTLELNFDDPFSISSELIDRLVVVVLDREIFTSLSGIIIATRYKMEAKLPKQMKAHGVSKTLDKLGLKMQGWIDSFSSNSVVFNMILQVKPLTIGSGLVMSRLWGLISSMQLIVLMPLISVSLPGNVQLLYYFISYNMNFQVIPMDLQSYGILEFNQTIDDEQAFTRQFEDHGYISVFMLQNLSENVTNVASVLFFTSMVLMLELIALQFNRRYTWLSMIKHFFCFNFMIMVLLENSLQFMIFSIINILNYSQCKTPSEIVSLVLSLVLMTSIFGVVIKQTIRVHRNTPQENLEIRERNEDVASYFELMRTSNKSSLLYQSVYFGRRFCLSLILVFLKEYPVLQVFLMICVTLTFIAYIASVRPFESKGLNFLELFNEVVVLTCLYHMLAFTGVLGDQKDLMYQVGWSMDVVLIIQFILNIIIIAYQFLQTLWAMLRRFLRAQRLKAIEERRLEKLKKEQLKSQEPQGRLRFDSDANALIGINGTQRLDILLGKPSSSEVRVGQDTGSFLALQQSMQSVQNKTGMQSEAQTPVAPWQRFVRNMEYQQTAIQNQLVAPRQKSPGLSLFHPSTKAQKQPNYPFETPTSPYLFQRQGTAHLHSEQHTEENTTPPPKPRTQLQKLILASNMIVEQQQHYERSPPTQKPQSQLQKLILASKMIVEQDQS